MDSAGVRVGTRGHPAAFAFYANKQLVTGEGGMLTTGDERVLEQARSERNQGRAHRHGLAARTTGSASTTACPT